MILYQPGPRITNQRIAEDLSRRRCHSQAEKEDPTSPSSLGIDVLEVRGRIQEKTESIQ